MLGVSMGLIDLYGRVDDATIGRFLSADPYIPDAENDQSFNRYGYVNDNPFTFVDPSGFGGHEESNHCFRAVGCRGDIGIHAICAREIRDRQLIQLERFHGKESRILRFSSKLLDVSYVLSFRSIGSWGL